MTETSDPVERLGIARSRQALTGADMVILMLDSSQPLTEEDTELMGRANGKSAVTVANKSDLAAAVDSNALCRRARCTSMVTREGLELLKERMAEAALNGKGAGSGEALVSNVRQKAALESAAGHLASAEKALTEGLADDFVTIDLTAALNSLGEITGETVTEDLLHTIFSRFCIGK